MCTVGTTALSGWLAVPEAGEMGGGAVPAPKVLAFIGLLSEPAPAERHAVFFVSRQLGTGPVFRGVLDR